MQTTGKGIFNVIFLKTTIFKIAHAIAKKVQHIYCRNIQRDILVS